MRIHPVRHFILILGLLLIPMAVYWNTITYRFGFRDDYSILREAHEEPGKILRVCSETARPIYGYVLEESFAVLAGVSDLSKIRLLAALLMGAVSVLLFNALCRQGWERAPAALLALLIALLPGSQVLVSWAIAWPLALGLVFAIAAFECSEKSTRTARPMMRFLWWITGVALVAASTLTYQAVCLFYLVPLTAGLFAGRESWNRQTGQWIVRHVVTVALGLGLSLVVMLRWYAAGHLGISSRVALSQDVESTLAWFFRFPLPNALALFALDGVGTNVAIYLATAAAVGALLLAGIVLTWRKQGWKQGLLTALATLALPMVAHAANLVSTERLASYRTLLPLSGVILGMATVHLGRIAGRKMTAGILGTLVGVGLWSAHYQPFDLIAQPQSQELGLIEAGVRQVNPARSSRIFVITPALEDTPSPYRVGDEFGSLGTNSDWVPKEMLGVAMDEAFGDQAVRYTMESGEILPREKRFDIVIDMRRLREFRAR